MFIENLLNQGSAPVLEQVVKFTAARHRLIAENMANISTPGYRQKDLSVEGFNRMMQERIAQRREAAPGSVSFEDVSPKLSEEGGGILFHDQNNRSTEQLATDLARNALMHNMAIELLRKQYQAMEMALKERIA